MSGTQLLFRSNRLGPEKALEKQETRPDQGHKSRTKEFTFPIQQFQQLNHGLVLVLPLLFLFLFYFLSYNAILLLLLLLKTDELGMGTEEDL